MFIFKKWYCHVKSWMESKEISESKSTLTQDTMSRTVFPSSKIFLLSFNFQGIVAWGFQMHLLWIFVSWFFVWICLLSNFFFTGVFWFLPYAYQFLLLEIHLPVHWAIQTKTMRKYPCWNNFWKVVRTSVICLKMMLENFVWKKSTNFDPWVKFVVIIFIFLRCPFSVKEWLKKDVSLS